MDDKPIKTEEVINLLEEVANDILDAGAATHDKLMAQASALEDKAKLMRKRAIEVKDGAATTARYVTEYGEFERNANDAGDTIMHRLGLLSNVQ